MRNGCECAWHEIGVRRVSFFPSLLSSPSEVPTQAAAGGFVLFLSGAAFRPVFPAPAGWLNVAWAPWSGPGTCAFESRVRAEVEE